MRKLRNIISPTLTAALLTMQLAPGFLLPKKAQAVIADGAPAIDVLGQFDPDSTPSFVPDFTRDGANSGPYDFGFNLAAGVVLDTANQRLFVADTFNNRVLAFNTDSSGNLLDNVADNVLGQADMNSASANRGGSTAANTLVTPRGLFWDSANSRLFVTDAGNNRVLIYDLSSGIINGMAASNVLGQADFTSGSANRGGSVAADTLYLPEGVEWDSANNRLIVADSTNRRVLFYDLATVADGEPAVNVFGQSGFTTRTCATSSTALCYPYYTEIDPANNRLFVSDSSNNRVLAYDIATVADGEPAVNVLGQADFTSGSANRGGSVASNTMYSPRAMVWDSSDSLLYVAEYSNNRITVYDLATVADGEPAVNVLGQADFTSNTGTTTATGLYYPNSLERDSANNRLYVSDYKNSRILYYDIATVADGEPALGVIGQPATVSSSFPPVASGTSFTRGGVNGGPFEFSTFSYPRGMAMDTVGHRLFAVDSINNRVVVFDTDSLGRPIDRVPDYVLGQSSFTGGTSGRTASTMDYPFGAAFDSGNQRLFVSDQFNNRVLVFDLSPGITNGMAASYVLGQADFTSGTANRGGSVASNTMNNPQGIEWDSANSRLIVADSYNNRILFFDAATIADGEPAVNVLGQADFTSASGNRGVTVAANSLYSPVGVDWDSTNSRLFAADYYNHRVLLYDLATIADGESAVNVLGQADFTSSSANRGGSVAANTLNIPYDCAWDSTNSRLFVSDYRNNRVLSFDLATVADGEDAVNVLGQADFTSSDINRGGSVAANSLYYPWGMAWNSLADNLYVSDYFNHRVLVFDVGTTAGTTEATTQNKVTLSRLAAGASADFSLSFDLAHVVSSTLTVTFPAGFTVTAPATAGASSSCLSNFGYTSNTLTADKSLCGGPITLGGATVTLPSTPGTYTITWVNDDPGSATIVIVSNDQISITATVASTVSFLAVAQPAASTCSNAVDLTGADYTLALGTLNVATITESESLNADSSTVERICTQGSTNATSGMAVTVKNANGSSGLVSSSVPADTIPSSASGQIAAGAPGYGVCVKGSSLASDSGLTPAGVDPTATGSFSTYECESASGNIVALDGTAQGLWSATGPTQDATAAVWVRVAISATQPAHNDYADSLTFVATATY